MKRFIRIAFLSIFSAIFLFGCAIQHSQVKLINCGPVDRAGQYVKNIDNFLVVFDASGSMYHRYKDERKVDIAKGFVKQMNMAISDLKLNGAMRIFGNSVNPFVSNTELVYGLAAYSAAGLERPLKDIDCLGGNSPMCAGIDGAAGDLKTASGDIAVIVVSDGMESNNSAVASAQQMKQQLGERVCIYTVLVGNNPAGKALMKNIADVGSCGAFYEAANLNSCAGMNDFVKKVFFKQLMGARDADKDGVIDSEDKCPATPAGVAVNSMGCPRDGDRDGVCDYRDKCPTTPAGAAVDATGCCKDTDRDGVPDYLDKCPKTPLGEKVDENGCWVFVGLFDTAKYDIKPEALQKIDDIVSGLTGNPALTLKIQGHTDNTGSHSFNQTLSENRARAIMNVLIEKGVDPKRLSAEGFGGNQPVATNDTPEGRAKNRRVELKIDWK